MKTYEICYKGNVYKVRKAWGRVLFFSPEHPRPSLENIQEVWEIIRKRDAEDATKKLTENNLKPKKYTNLWQKSKSTK